jgi:hypothetical protein
MFGWVEDLINDALEEVAGGLIDPLKKFFKRMFDNIKTKFLILLKEVTDEITSIFKLIEEWFEEEVIGFFNDAADAVVSVVDEIVAEIEKLGPRVENIGSGLEEIFVGIGYQFVELGEGIGESIEGTGEVLHYSFEYLKRYIICSVKFLKNLYKCIFFYILHAIGKLIYLPVRIVLWIMYTFLRFDAYGIEKQVWDGLETLDTMFFELFDVHIIHYPKKIRDDCYTCIRLKSSTVGNKSSEVNDTISKIIPNLFSSNPHYEKSGRHFDEVGASNPRSASKIK